jgi:curved DNA-binding protein CbpA
MKDFFALLGEPRKPWLDPEKLQERYRQLGLTNHPDRIAAGATGDDDFASITEAYRIVSDPKLRLHHLLQLEGHDPAEDGRVPESLLEPFSLIGDFIARMNRLWPRWQEADNALSKSLLRAEITQAEREVAGLLDSSRRLLGGAEEAARALNDSWKAHPKELAEIYRLFGFLTRWMAQLEEWKFRIESA